MEFHLDTSNATYHIEAYTPGQVTINQTVYTSNLIVTANQLIVPWLAKDLASLTTEQLSPILDYQPEIVLFGTGEQMQLAPAWLIHQLNSQRIGLEVMACSAACRTYTVLAAEQRRVLAALLLETKV